jgi:hypothetical protein
MFKTVLIGSLLISATAFAQDMSKNEDYESAYIEQADGSSKYIGKCLTHEDYENSQFNVKNLIQKYVEPAELSDQDLKALVKLIGADAVKKVFKVLGMNEISEEGASQVSIFKDYIDDITVEAIELKGRHELNLLRFNVGIGGGNGAFVVLNQVTTGTKRKLQLMSYTMDSDLNYCDRAVWNQ